MRHRLSGRKLGKTTSHRLAMLRNMATSLFRHERITTTVPKAKELRSFAEKLITIAKQETLHARRRINRHIKDREVVTKLFDVIGIRFATRPGGYTRIIRTGYRRGDAAEMAIIELVDTSMKPSAPKKKAAADKKKAAARKAAPPKPTRKGTAREAALADVAAAEEAAEVAKVEEETADDTPAGEDAGSEPESEAADSKDAKEEDSSEDEKGDKK